MGCSGSKAEDLPLVVRCRERRDLIRAAADHRYALAAAHVSYFRSLKDVGDALRKFVDEELVTASPSPSSSSSFSSPSLILPPSSRKKRDGPGAGAGGDGDESSLHLHDDGDEVESHLHLSDSSSSSDVDSEDHIHHHLHNNHDHNHHHHHHNNHNHHGHKSGHDSHQHHNNQRKNFDDEARHLHNDADSSSHYPHRGVNAYGNNRFGDGFAADPFSNPYSYPYPYQPPPHSYGDPYTNQWDLPVVPPVQPWYYSGNSNMYYMKKSAPASKTVVQQPPQTEPVYGYSDSYYNPSYTSSGYGGNNYGYSSMENNPTLKPNSAKEAEVPPPPSPKGSAWDFFDPFNGFENGYPSYYPGGRYGYGSNSSSPDSTEVREREGIPDLEEETESEVYKEVLKGNRVKVDSRKTNVESNSRSKPMPMHKKNEANSRSIPPPKNETSSKSVQSNRKGQRKSRLGPHHKSESNSWSSEESEKPKPKPSQSMSQQYNVPPQHNGESQKQSIPPQHSEKSSKQTTSPTYSKGTSNVDQSLDTETGGSISLSDEKSSNSSENVVLKSVDEGSVKKRGVTFEVEGTSKQDGESSMLSSFTVLSPHGNRDLREVVAEIRDEFETASSYGKEVAMLLEVGKMPYQRSLAKVILSRMLYLVSPSQLLHDPPSTQSAKSASDTTKLAASYFEEVGKDVNSKAFNLSSTLDKLYAWEKKLYKEVKDEERLRIIYEKQCKRLKYLDEEGAESTKIDATRASIRRLLTKLDVSIRAIDAISIRIHKLRDEELQPQVAKLIHGLTRMWKSMLKCHQKQFQAVMDTKMRKLRAKTGPQTDTSNSTATTALEKELRSWCERFNEWITFQKSYIDSLNNWLLHCLHYEPEQTPDGPAPYSPGRIGAPPIFVICHDWHEAMESVSEKRVTNAMNVFAASLRQLWEKQDEEGRQRLKAEYLSNDYKKHLRAHRMEIEKKDETGSAKTGLSVVQSDPLDDLKVDLDSMREKLVEERVKHKDAMRLVHDAASSSLQGGLVPIFKALESFTSEALKAHEHVRLQNLETSSN